MSQLENKKQHLRLELPPKVETSEETISELSPTSLVTRLNTLSIENANLRSDVAQIQNINQSLNSRLHHLSALVNGLSFP